MHLIENREPNLQYETRLLDVAIVQNAKNGYSPQKTIHTFLQINSIQRFRQLVRKCFGKGNTAQLQMLNEFRDVIKQRQRQMK